MTNDAVKSFSDGEVYFWIEQGETIHLKASSSGDPAELTETEAEKLALALLEAVRQIKALDSN